MLVGLVALSMVLIWGLTSLVLTRAFREAGRAVVLDDLGEYEALYERVGVEGVRNLFTAGKHERDQILRIVEPSGRVKLDVMLPGQPGFNWPELKYRSPQVGRDCLASRINPDGATLTMGAENWGTARALVWPDRRLRFGGP
jgi:hypothetical protein